MAASKDDPKAVVDESIAAVQKIVDKADERGFYGTAVDPTPRENYTVSGVTAGKPTPETDAAAAEAARAERVTPPR